MNTFNNTERLTQLRDKSLLTPEEAADYISMQGCKVSTSWLSKMRVNGGGPLFNKFGNKRVIYTVSSLDQWMNSKLSEPLASTSAINS